MSKENDTNWDFDPSNEDEFVRNIEKALREKTESEKVDINLNDDGIQIIDLKETDEGSKEQISNEKQENKEQKNSKEEQINVNDNIEHTEHEDNLENIDDFAAFEKAVHNVAEIKLNEDIEDIKKLNEQDVSDDMIVDDITKSLAKLEEEDPAPAVTEGETIDEKQKMKLWKKIAIPVGCVLMTILLLFLFVRFTKPGQNLAIKVGAMFAASRTTYDDGSELVEQVVEDEIEEDEKVIVELPVVQEDEVDLKAEEGTARHEDYAVNILLLGEEAIDSGTSRGRTDLMIIASLNTKDKSIKLTSLMRDMYVQIPGHLDNKLNSAYATGGIPLLYETIELNFDLKLDGYILVGFNDFEKIIDLMDGVDISLTKTEANWLNTTNYISNPSFRNVVAGANHMNGNQALGYCRIRSVGTAAKEYNDFGRTSRHRIVLEAIFNKYKSLDLWDLAMIANSCLPMVTTDLDAGEIETYLKIALDIGLNQLEQNRIPADGTFENANIRKMSVIVPDLQKNVTILHEFIFGTAE